jgi:methylglyoxal/glyoxal reductase
MEITHLSTIVLNNGIKMPRLGLGTARMTDIEVASNAVKTAIQIGYRLIDTSKNYDNEEPVGMGIRESGHPESQIFLTTKLEKEDYRQAKEGLAGSFQRLGVRKIDLYLIHAPEDDAEARITAWRTLSELVDGERLRAIGVSNYEVEHMEEIQRAGLPVPTVNQIELTPANFGEMREIVEYCRRHTIALMAYSPLGVGDLLNHPTIVETAERYRKSPAQVLIRWGLQHNFIVIPKSDQEDHIRANFNVFDFVIADDDMAKLNQL